MPVKIGLKSTILPDNIICRLKSGEDLETTFNYIATSCSDWSGNEIENKKSKI